MPTQILLPVTESIFAVNKTAWKWLIWWMWYKSKEPFASCLLHLPLFKVIADRKAWRAEEQEAKIDLSMDLYTADEFRDIVSLLLVWEHQQLHPSGPSSVT